MTGFAALPIADEAQDHHGRRWAGVARVLGPAWSQLPSLTVGLFGVQILWSVELSYASPYLLALGLPKSLMAIVFLAGPLSGLIVQPAIGIIADNSKSRFGRRRPYILVCAVLCAFATLSFGFARQFASIFTTLDSPSNDLLTIWLAVLSVYCIDFSINVVQALDRALIVDILPTSKQPAGNAWAARMQTVGAVAGFFIGNLDLPHLFPFFGTAQLQVFCVIAVLLLLFTQAWMCFHVKERVLLTSSSDSKRFQQELWELWGTLLTLPRVIRQICWIQFFASLGWFPIFFYSTVYIGDFHKKSTPIPQNKDAAIALDTESTRLATRALFYSSLVSLVVNIVIPSLVAPHHARHASSPLEPKRKTWFERVRMHLASLWAFSHLLFATCMAATFFTSTISGATWIMAVIGFCSAVSQWAPFALLGEAILSHPASDDAGSIHLADTRSTRIGWSHDNDERAADEETRRLFRVDGDEEEEEGDAEAEADGDSLPSKRSFDPDERDLDIRSRVNGFGHPRARVSRVDITSPSVMEEEQGLTNTMLTSVPTTKAENGNGLSAQAGSILGIHNVFIVIPQFLMTGLSSLIFALLDPGKSVLRAGHVPPASGHESSTVARSPSVIARDEEGQGTDSIGIVFRLGGIAAVIAFVLAYRLAKDLKRH